MIRPALELARKHRAHYFIADYHGLTTIQDPDTFNRRIDELAATWLALGLDPERVVFYRQSAVPKIFELMWVLAQPDELRRLVMRIVTDSRRSETPKEPEQCNLFSLNRVVAMPGGKLRRARMPVTMRPMSSTFQAWSC